MTPSCNPLVYVIVVNWNGWRDTVECLESLKKLTYPHYRVVVVDNGSTDESLTKLQPYVPWITLIPTGQNLGFSGGNNVGIRYALDHGADFVFLLNNDTVVAPGILEQFTRAANEHPEAAMFGAKILQYDRRDTLWFAGGDFGEDGLSCHHRYGGQTDSPALTGVADSPFLTGCALFMRAKAVADIGLLDEEYFCLWEDTDLSKRFLARGFRNLVVLDATVWHKESRSFGGNQSPQYTYYFQRNHVRFAGIHGGNKQAHIRAFRKYVFLSIRNELPLRMPWRWPTVFAVNWRQWASLLLALRDIRRSRYGKCPDWYRLVFR